jgi:hypothetical protein
VQSKSKGVSSYKPEEVWIMHHGLDVRISTSADYINMQI